MITAHAREGIGNFIPTRAHTHRHMKFILCKQKYFRNYPAIIINFVSENLDNVLRKIHVTNTNMCKR